MKSATKNSILLLGGKGFIGNSIYQKLKKKFYIKILSKRFGQDLRKSSEIKKYLKNKICCHCMAVDFHIFVLWQTMKINSKK